MITYLNNPIRHSNTPTINANNIASSVYSSSEEWTIPPNTLETKRDTSATGPIASCRDEPNIAYTKIGTRPESVPEKHIETLETIDQPM